MVASCGVASTIGAMDSARGRDADFSTVGDQFSLLAVALGSSPSQDRSVDFLHSTTSVISQARLPTYLNYSKIDYTHKLDRTTVTVGAPSMLAISTSPASAGASSSTWATTCSTAPVAAKGSGLLSSVGARGSPVTAACYAVSGMVASTVGDGLSLLLVAPPTVSQFSSSPWSTGSDGGISCDTSRFNCQHVVLYGSTRLHYSMNSPLGQSIQ
jgi:hypothetical protein